MSALGTGRARITAEGKSRIASVSGGFVSVKRGVVSLVATTFEFADEIDINRAREAKQNAENALANVEKTAEAALKAKLARAVSRITVWESHK